MPKFKKLRGNRVFLEMPKQDESKLYVDENTKEALNTEMIIKMSKLKVHTVGDLVTDLKSGDTVLVDPEDLQKARIIPLSGTESVILISAFEVIMIW